MPPRFLIALASALIALTFLTLSSCSSSRSGAVTSQKAYNPCGDLQTNLYELQQIEDELADPGPDYTLDKQNQAQERRRHLHRTNERLKKDCGR